MKHNFPVTLVLIAIFIISQLIGLYIVSQYVDIDESARLGETVLNEELYLVEPPRVENENTSFVPIFLMILVATAIVLLLVRFKQRNVWKLWFFLSVAVALSFAFAPLVRNLLEAVLPSWLAASTGVTIILAAGIATWKIFFPNVVIHNLTEMFIYGGIASLLIPVLNVVSAIVLLLLISAYDVYAVWKSKHMVTLANFQTDSKVFAGLQIPYRGKTSHVSHKKMPAPPRPSHAKKGMKTAILGGGDVAFPLLFSSALLKQTGAFTGPVLVTLFAAAALFGLFILAKKDKFYPAMPFVTAGCMVGFGLSFLV